MPIDAAADTLLAGYLPEEKLCRALGETPRTARLRRQRGDAPPYVKLGRRVLYPIDGFREWLERREVAPASQRPRRGKN